MVRDMPHLARRVLGLASRGNSAPFSSFTSTSSLTTKNSSPFGPLAVTFWPSTWRSHLQEPERASYRYETYWISTCLFVMRGSLCRSEDRAKHFATNVLFASLVIGHHTLRSRKDGDAEAVRDLRNGLDRDIDAAARLGHAVDLADHRLRLRSTSARSRARTCRCRTRPWNSRGCSLRTAGRRARGHEASSRRRNRRLAAHLRVADAGEHIAQWISHDMVCVLLTSST
jgi:hypothetical protein